nr:sacsin-like [Pocillopora verrucosa]
MFEVSEKIQKDFPDVFRCYLGELERFSADNSTIFRFPLRSEEMAIGSKISSRPVTLEKLDRMMEELKRELFEVLLFVDNVKKITLCEVEKTSGKLVDYYTVEVTLTEEDEEKRKYFAAVIKEVGNLIKQGKILPTDSPVVKVSYILKITDNRGNEEKWLIVQQIGFQGDVKSTIVDAFMKQKLGMLPRGGVACLLEKKFLESPVQRRKKAFCFLPLPLETNLPVHINGHFALDHESRRNLWRDEAGHVGYRSDWNNALLEDVVASCYIDMLGEVQRLLGFGLNRSTETEVLAKIRTLESLFPQKPTTDQYWKTLVDSVYQEIDKKKLNLLPVVRHSAQRGRSSVDVTWLPPTGMGKQKAFFNNLADAGPFAKIPEKDMEEAREKRRQKFERMLLRSGFNLVAFSMKMHDSFKRSGVATSCISAGDLIEFYGTFGSHDPLCTIGPIPCDVSKTVFEDEYGVKLVLLFCKEADDFLDKLPGLPLLLTQDNCLQLFSNVYPKFQSRFKDLLPGSPQIFLHEEIYWKVFCTSDSSKLTVLKPLDADAFATNLAETLPRETYGKSNYVQWSPAQKGVPNQRWICRVWEFLYDITRDVINDKEIDDGGKVRQVKAIIHPLLDWSILPVTQIRSFGVRHQVDHFLLPLRGAQGAIDMANVDAASAKLVKVLRKLGIPELNQRALSHTISATIMYSSSTSLAVALMLVSSLKDPSSLLVSLQQKLILNQQEIRERLEESDCKEILEYFCSSVSCLRESDQSNLRKLPFYLATNGGFMSLEKVKVSVLPAGVPQNEIDVLESALGMAFVKSWENVTDLFRFLELTCISAVDVYCDSILPSFNLLSEEARQVHLEYIRDTILTDSTEGDEEKERLLEILKCTPLIPSKNGTLKKASCVYDPNNEVFKAMLSCDFPSEPFDSPEWISFLRQVGLVSEVSSVDFKRFAKEVEHEALTAQTEKTHEKSRTLVDHLISRHDVVGEGLLNAIRDIAFVVADPVAHQLQQLCPPFKQKQGDQVPYIPFKGAVFADYEEIVWTQAHLLPTWANPEFRRYQLGPPPLASVDKYCDAFVSQLQIIKKPPIDIVVRHCEVLCHHLENLRKCKLDLSEHRCQITNVMEQIYKFLQDNADERGTIVLEVTPCILVENGTRFVRPGKAVLELQVKDEIKPFLYRVPPELGKFRKLFQTLGCDEFVTCAHYAVVLKNLQKDCGDAKLHPNELKMCFKAVKGFFETLQEKSEEASALSTLSTLYLPATPSGIRCLEKNLNTISVTLHKSSELVFNDVPAYEDRIKELHQHFLLDLKLMKVRVTLTMTNFKELMMKLPLQLQPKMLSLVVREKLIDGVFVKSSVFDLMMLRLCTPHFGQGIARIIKHDNSQKSDFDEDVIADIEKSLKRIQLCAVDSLKTALFLNDNLIPGSERDTKSFQEKCEIHGEEKCMVYVNVVNATNDTDLARSLLSGVVIEMYGDLLGKSAYLIPSMLQCAPNEIWSLLDKSDIRQDDTCSLDGMDIFPDPGSFIPVEDHHLLNDAFGDFEPGEYVGYQLHDPSLQLDRGVATFIYAVIIEEVMAQDVGCNEDWVLRLVTKVYSVNIGHEHEPVEVTATKLYKFCRFEEISNAQRRNREDREEVLLQISTILENAWKCDLSEGERRQIVKRVILQWRPEKNIGDEEFCFEVSKHIIDELFRLGGSHEEFNDACVEIAKEHRLRREEYQEKVLQRYTSQDHEPWRNVPPSFSSSNPQPGEAERWYKQAKADLEAGGNEIDSGKPSYEWVCFKCHQAAEKALKAAQYTLHAEKTDDHNLNRICNGLNDAELANFASQLERLVGGSARMRYPDCFTCPQIPHEVYSSQQARESLHLATEIVTRVKPKIDEVLKNRRY